MKSVHVENGAKFGKWTVLEDIAQPNRRMLRVVCDCGVEVTVSKSNVILGKSKSCRRCRDLPSRIIKPVEELARSLVYYEYIKRSRKKGIDFSLTREHVYSLIEQPCYYCGEIGSNFRKVPKREGGLRYNGLDRRNPRQGYLSDNVLPCCRYCNRMKSDLSHDEFFKRINLLVARWGEKPAINIVAPATASMKASNPQVLTRPA